MTGAPPPGEFELIARHFAPLAGEGALGLLDDVACLEPPAGEALVLSKDMLVEGVHFFPDDPPASIARKALGVNLSDLAAKGARPLGFLLGLGRTRGQDEAWLAEFARGLAAKSKASHCPLLGGDTVNAPALTLSITVLGAAPKGRMVPRQGGALGDILYVSGTIGDAALGLKIRLDPQAGWIAALNENQKAHLLDRYLHPRPRLALAPALLAHASAAMDVSDGLVGDADKLAAAFGASCEISRVPLSEAAQAAIRAAPALLETALTGGDDYEILCAVPPHHACAFVAEAREAGIDVTKIGLLGAAGAEKTWQSTDGGLARFTERAYTHRIGRNEPS